ncbi:MAG: cob(I)yrinic acid a,c-diamide adenosyltransferase [Verrucomicrobia bacterium]|nr:cob(I)yrinic acid a,c-diamide adenosyltransferase [Kiritimatiellia bacterium]MCO6400158.1 cob(I)yrinic acid a,c-diamide adenosyltransferase [Verrucomicrobiota bacterium]
MNKPQSITTKVGDKGTTVLLSGEVVDKDSPRTMAYGDLDELVSILGVARCHVKRADVSEEILFLQRNLFLAGAEMATTSEFVKMLRQRIEEPFLEEFEVRRDRWEHSIVMPKGFIIPGGSGSLAAAHLDHARAVSRRLERRAVRMARESLISNPAMMRWLNRLSDFLWLLARAEEGESLSLHQLRTKLDGQRNE